MRRRLTIETLLVVVAFMTVFVLAVRPTVDPDLWWHLASGRWMIEQRSIIGGDPFSWTRAGVTRVPADWLGQITFYAVWATGGLTAVWLFVAALASAGMAAIYRACRGPVTMRVGVVVLAAMTASVFWSARPQMYTFLFSAFTVLVLARRGEDPSWRGVWWLVPLFALWANLHGGAVFGVVILTATVLGELADRLVARRRVARGRVPSGSVVLASGRTDRRLVAVDVACIAVLAANPGGAAVYLLPWEQLSLNVALIEEYRPPSWSDSAMWPFFAMLLLTVAVVARRWRAVQGADLLLVVLSALLALRITRAVSFFAVVAAPILCRYAAAWVDDVRAARQSERGRTVAVPSPAHSGVLAAILIVAVLASCVAVGDRLERAHADVADSFPVAASSWSSAHPQPGHLFNSFTWGGYLVFEDPSVPVAIDGRNDLYGAYLDTYLMLASAQGDWAAELDRQGINTVFIPSGLPLATALEGSPSWHRVYSDGRAVIYTRVRADMAE